MSFLIIGTIFVLGICVGSFLNVLILRLDQKGGIVAGRSECPNCGHILAWYDLVPLASFLLLGRKCRYCRKAISWQYPVVELFTGILLAVFVYKNGFMLNWQYFLFLAGLLGFWTLLLFDYKYFILPDKIIIPLVIFTVLSIAIFNIGMLINALLTGLLAAGVFDILYVVSGGKWIGFGDIKLLFLIGVFFGYPLTIPVVFVSIWTAAIVGIIMMFTGKASLKTALPFGSFLSAVSIIAILVYDDLVFLRLFF